MTAQTAQTASPTQGDAPQGKGGSGGSGDAPPPAPRPRASAPGWSKARAYRGDTVLLGARLRGFPANTQVTFKIFPSTSEPSRAIGTVNGVSEGENGLASAEWTVRFDPSRHDDPRLLFEASADGKTGTSPILLVVDWAEMTLKNEQGGPLANVPVAVVDAIGRSHETRTDGSGRFRIDPIPIGQYAILVKDHLVDGERGPGQKKFDTGKRNEATLKRMVYTIEFETPKAGEVYLAGDAVEIKTIVKRDGKPEQGEPLYKTSGTPSARVTDPSAQAGKGAGGAAMLMVGDHEGEVELLAEYQGTRQSVKVKVVKPEIARLEFLDNGENLFPLYDHKQGDRVPAVWEWGPDGRLKEGQHSVAAKLGTKLKLRLNLRASERPSKPAKLVLAVATPPVMPWNPPGQVSAIGPQPIIFFLPDDQASAGVDWSGDEGTNFDLEARTPLPKYIARHEWKLEVKVAGPGGMPTPAAVKGARLLGEVSGVEVFSIWGKPAIGGGGIQEPGTEPLQSSEFDAYHLRIVTEWAAFAWNLVLDGGTSIPAQIQGRASHPMWPDGYEGKQGKRGGEHPRPLNYAELPGGGIYGEGQSDAPRPRPGVVQYRCAAHPAGSFPHYTSVSTFCQAELKYFFIWKDGAYQCGSIACNYRYDPASGQRLDRCPRCGQSGAYLEVQCSACREWVDERAFATGQHRCEAGAEPQNEGAGAGPMGSNWGFGVIDNPENPGGRPHQVASLVAACLNALGIKATVWYKRRRNNNRVKRAWVAVPPDAQNDSLFPGQKVHEDDWALIGPPLKRGQRRRILRRIEEAARDDD